MNVTELVDRQSANQREYDHRDRVCAGVPTYFEWGLSIEHLHLCSPKIIDGKLAGAVKEEAPENKSNSAKVCKRLLWEERQSERCKSFEKTQEDKKNKANQSETKSDSGFPTFEKQVC